MKKGCGVAMMQWGASTERVVFGKMKGRAEWFNTEKGSQIYLDLRGCGADREFGRGPGKGFDRKTPWKGKGEEQSGF